jgi:hypothetical protein
VGRLLNAEMSSITSNQIKSVRRNHQVSWSAAHLHVWEPSIGTSHRLPKSLTK